MILTLENLLLIAGMCLVTAIPRVAPLIILSGRRLNPALESWLKLVPPGVLAAILLPELILAKAPDGTAFICLTPDNLNLIAALPSFLAAWFFRSFFGAVITGMLVMALLRFLF